MLSFEPGALAAPLQSFAGQNEHRPRGVTAAIFVGSVGPLQEEPRMFFDGAHDLLRILVVGTGAYLGLVFILRIAGKRTLSKMNAFDLVVTVAFGSTLASVLLNRDISLSEGLLAFALLAGLQFAVTFTSVRSERFQLLVKAQPSQLFYRGQFLPEALRQERVTEKEVFAAVRAHGIEDIGSVEAVVLETDSSFSVIAGGSSEAMTSLRHVRHASTAEREGEPCNAPVGRRLDRG